MDQASIIVISGAGALIMMCIGVVGWALKGRIENIERSTDKGAKAFENVRAEDRRLEDKVEKEVKRLDSKVNHVCVENVTLGAELKSLGTQVDKMGSQLCQVNKQLSEQRDIIHLNHSETKRTIDDIKTIIIKKFDGIK